MNPIPQLPPLADQGLLRVLRALKENSETLTGARGSKIATLESAATTAEIIAKVNEIIARLQG